MKELLEILREIVAEQGTTEISGTDWAGKMIDKINKIEIMDNELHLSKNLKHLRESREYSIAQICVILEIQARSTYHSYESGISNPPLKTLKKLSVLYNTTIEKLAFTDLTL